MRFSQNVTPKVRCGCVRSCEVTHKMVVEAEVSMKQSQNHRDGYVVHVMKKDEIIANCYTRGQTWLCEVM